MLLQHGVSKVENVVTFTCGVSNSLGVSICTMPLEMIQVNYLDIKMTVLVFEPRFA